MRGGKLVTEQVDNSLEMFRCEEELRNGAILERGSGSTPVMVIPAPIHLDRNDPLQRRD